MKSCPVCNHTLLPPKQGNTEICTFCGWKGKKNGSLAQKIPPPYHALSAEELAKKEFKENHPSFRGILIVGLGLLLMTIFVIIQRLQPAPNSERTYLVNPTPQATKSAPPTPSPIPTFMQTPIMQLPSSSTTPSFAAPEFTDITPTPSLLNSGTNATSESTSPNTSSASPSRGLTPPPLPISSKSPLLASPSPSTNQ